MTTPKPTDAGKKTKTDLVNQYRPLGLKAVLAAALQLKGKKKPALAQPKGGLVSVRD
ncbi:hypothetical protein [Ensifer soli]|uniref:hypothetical protein n=1 Tax=Ciceribacter sp. sgz301302 TaxID=3342379 RepID=UPI0035B7BB5E